MEWFISNVVLGRASGVLQRRCGCVGPPPLREWGWVGGYCTVHGALWFRSSGEWWFFLGFLSLSSSRHLVPSSALGASAFVACVLRTSTARRTPPSESWSASSVHRIGALVGPPTSPDVSRATDGTLSVAPVRTADGDGAHAATPAEKNTISALSAARRQDKQEGERDSVGNRRRVAKRRVIDTGKEEQKQREREAGIVRIGANPPHPTSCPTHTHTHLPRLTSSLPTV